MMSDQEKLLTETKIDNSDLRDKIYKIQGHVQDVWPHDTEGDGRNNYGTEDAPNQSVLDWTVEDVYLWWRVALPRGAQRYIELVKECQLTGVDLLGVDEEMLSQFGMMKVLIHQVLKQIGHLKKIALNDNEYDGTKMARSKSKDRKADPSRDSRAYAEGTKDRVEVAITATKTNGGLGRTTAGVIVKPLLAALVTAGGRHTFHSIFHSTRLYKGSIPLHKSKDPYSHCFRAINDSKFKIKPPLFVLC
eukprot:TRINITY_DN249_c0_g1_i2.p1 TRINITY_DN249_c0_g1~~TRINITY_DN249_c0_g1_i2.p1  ORF type:complete len:247 (+),score=25.81 TRINITY_DN249_c0_g1_i2:82-822(+)